MFQLRRILQTIAFVLFATVLASFALSEDKPVPTTNLASNPANIDVENETKNDAPVVYIIYFSDETTRDVLQTAQKRFYASNDAVRAAKKKLNGGGGMRNIADSGDLDSLAKRMPGGMAEAKRLVPMIEDGWHILLIMNPEQTEWSVPWVLNPYADIFEQIKFARRQDKNSNPRRYLAASPPPSSPTPPPAPSPAAGAPQPK